MVKSTSFGAFDALVIGSSPLMLLQAQKLAHEGKRVCLVERQERLGGAWRSSITGSNQEIEIAGHLIEVFPGVYDALESASGVEFKVLEDVPIRITRFGARVRYYSRLLILLSGVRLFMGYAKALFLVRFTNNPDHNRLLNFKHKLRSFWKYQLNQFWSPQPVKGPAGGYVNFIKGLVEQTKSSGVQFLQCDVIQAEFAKGIWQVSFDDGSTLSAAELHSTTSTNLDFASSNSLAASKTGHDTRYAAIIGVKTAHLSGSPAYVAFWRDAFCPRISRIDTLKAEKSGSQRFLFELVEQPDSLSPDFISQVKMRMEKAGIVGKSGTCSLLEIVECDFVRNVDQLQPLEQVDNLYCYHSSGNLAAGIAAWLSNNRKD